MCLGWQKHTHTNTRILARKIRARFLARFVDFSFFFVFLPIDMVIQKEKEN